ncbi:MAG: hypothetical protein ACK4F8_01585 [Aquabacterium sp.]
MRCNIVLYQPNVPSLINLKAYDDVARSVAFGLQQAGHEAHLTVNSFLRDADRYYLFAAHLMPLELLQQFPPGTRVFNLEQYHHLGNITRAGLGPGMSHIVEHFQAIEYSGYNMPFWEAVQPTLPVIIQPIPYAACLQIPNAEQAVQDIDVLYYGSIGGERKLGFLMAAMGKSRIRPKTVLMQNIYGTERDDYIRRAKIVLSATGDRIFPEVRTSYLLSNQKAVISDIGETDLIDPFYRDNLIFADKHTIEDRLFELLTDDGKRLDYAQRCHALMKTRSIEAYINAIA